MRTFLIVLIFLPLLLGMRACSWMPSDFFKSLDGDDDLKLSFSEWMSYYGEHTHAIENCSRKDFYLADCDQDDFLTWEEYYNFRFRYQYCETAAVATLQQSLATESQSASPSRAALQKIVTRHAQELRDREERLVERYGLEQE